MAKGKYEYWLTEEGLLLLSAWARDGLTDEQISKKMGISRKTFYEWCKKYSDICNTIKKSKEIVDVQVENALLKRALGCQCVETRTKTTPGGEETVTVIKDIPPDVGAAAIWLKNRRPDKWKDKPTTENSEIMNKLDEIIGGITDAAAKR